MIPMDMAETPEHIDIRALSNIILRMPNTIRKWERDGVLPEHLHPSRDPNGRRFWTHSQIHGKRGIIVWMKKNDMRPGNTITDPSREAEHIANLRRPKKLNGHHVRSAKQMAKNGKTIDQILKRIFPRTKYATPQALEKALRKVAEMDGWDLPRRPRPNNFPPPRKRRKKSPSGGPRKLHLHR